MLPASLARAPGGRGGFTPFVEALSEAERQNCNGLNRQSLYHLKSRSGSQSTYDSPRILAQLRHKQLP
jgi:hypothetical protein